MGRTVSGTRRCLGGRTVSGTILLKNSFEKGRTVSETRFLENSWTDRTPSLFWKVVWKGRRTISENPVLKDGLDGQNFVAILKMICKRVTDCIRNPVLKDGWTDSTSSLFWKWFWKGERTVSETRFLKDGLDGQHFVAILKKSFKRGTDWIRRPGFWKIAGRTALRRYFENDFVGWTVSEPYLKSFMDGKKLRPCFEKVVRTDMNPSLFWK